MTPSRPHLPVALCCAIVLALVLAALAWPLVPAAARPGREGPRDRTRDAADMSSRTLSSLDADTQQGILDAMRAGRLSDDRRSVVFRNPEQQLQATIATEGTTITGRDGARVTFADASLGRRAPTGPDATSRVRLAPDASAPLEGVGTTRAVLARSAGAVSVNEWWTNSSAGIEQGFTVETRVEGEGLLTLEQSAVTTLTASVSEDGTAVTWSGDGQERLHFEHLRAWDSAGRGLPAWLEMRDDRLAMVVDDADARYPVTIDPTWTQQAYLKASNTQASDYFGYAVAVSGGTVVVGAYGEDSNATGVNGNESDNTAANAGAAYVFVRTGTTWTQQAYLKASNTGASDAFGYSVAVSGDTVVIGAPYEASNGTGPNGDQTNNTTSGAGAAYVFVRTGTTWTQQVYLKASNTAAGDHFGWSVAVSGDTVVVGAEGEDSAAPGVNGTQTDNSASGAGAAYVFTRTGTAWTQQAYLKASNPDAGDRFGLAVAASGDTVAVGADSEDSSATGVNGIGTDNSAAYAGAAYVFVRTGTTWSQQAYLKASNTGADDRFGYAVDVSGDTVVAGAYNEDSNATGVDGDGTNNSFGAAGAAYVFVRTGTAWAQQAYLKASNTGQGDQFGAAVAVSADTVVVAAPGETSNATGVNGDQTNNTASSAGAAYVFVRTGTTWSQQAYFKASNTGVMDGFGSSVAMSGNTVVVGAEREDSSATGVDGNQADNTAGNAGAAYVFRSDTVTITFGSLVGGNGTPFSTYSESGFTVDASYGPWENLATYGNPAPSIVFVRAAGAGPDLVAEAIITGSGGYFTFSSVDLYSSITPIPYVFTGFRNSTIVFQSSNTQPSTSGKFVTVNNPDASVAIDELRITLTNPVVVCCSNPMGFDNVVITPASAVTNGDFGAGLTGWATYATPDMSYVVASVSGGVLEFYRVPPPPLTSNQAVVFQETGMALGSSVPISATFDLGNSSTVRKRIAVLVHDSNWSDLTFCTFWLPAGAPLRTYEMRTHTGHAWGNATISFYAASTGSDGGAYQLDNVTLKYGPTQAATRTDCVDPLAPAPPGGGSSANLLANGDFGTGALSPWLTYGTLTWQIASHVFEFIRPDATPPAGVVFQASGSTAAAGEILTATFELGNSSSARKRVTVLLHDLDFTDLTACTWYLEPGASLAKYEIRTYVAESAGWSNATLSVYAATVGTDQWIRLDNVTLQRTPASAALGTECFDAGDPTAPLLVAGGRSSLNATATASLTATGSLRTRTDAATGLAWDAVASTSGTSTLEWPTTVDLRGAAAATLSFESWLSRGRSAGEVQVSLDGLSWQTVGVVPASGDWVPVAVDLSAFAGQPIRVRFVFEAVAPAAGEAEDRWLVRHVRISVGAPGSSKTPE